MLPFTLHLQDGVPVSDQIVQAVRKAILTRLLDDGDIFPSVRTLSQELRISPTTAHKVVSQLKDEGYLASRPGIGMVVIRPQLPSREERLAHLETRCRDLIREVAELQLGFPDAVEALRRAARAQNLEETPADPRPTGTETAPERSEDEP
jgi:DNA-binding transcriptional regulator YhcF (GntR family)